MEPDGPPAELTRVAADVDIRLRRLFDDELARWKELDPRLAEAIEELALVVNSGGKRLRAAFVYWAWRGRAGGAEAHPAHGAGPGERHVTDVGAAFELLQAFALVHDDIMDDSATRRGRPTVHVAQAARLEAEGWKGEPRRFGEGVAILVGDLSHAYADALMAEANPAARRIWDDLRIELSLGQYLDLRSAASGQLDWETARRVSTFKSALYTIVRPLQLGASLVAPASPALLAGLEAYGRPLGRAFQLKDDLLGVLGDERQVGKPVGDDLREGKPTELAAIAFERAGGDQQGILAGIGRRDLDAAEVDAIVEVFHTTGAVDEIEARIGDLVTEAVAAIDPLPFCEQAKGALASLADYVAARNS
ncbi:MAG: polyprenyl synthetase family protein [Acidimicrobiia bacterium]|nr:polyprenyl synthetase family protein [Acidimicrobiia bacterium]MDH4362535.1 polyprenyl synthetase family protein [Acidimicrobiia bacterium]MDH5290012.1 polyprenyl synthetase family protein [Acidimicrobiia bacterium]